MFQHELTPSETTTATAAMPCRRGVYPKVTTSFRKYICTSPLVFLASRYAAGPLSPVALPNMLGHHQSDPRKSERGSPGHSCFRQMVYIDTTSICYQANTLRYRVVSKKVNRYKYGLRVDIDRYCSIYLTAGKCRHISAKRRDGSHQYNRQKRKAGGVEERGGGARRGGGGGYGYSKQKPDLSARALSSNGYSDKNTKKNIN